MPEELSQLAMILGRIEGFMQRQDKVNDQQFETNQQMLVELKGIAKVLTTLGENDIAFEGHRTRTHDRFNNLNTTLAQMSLDQHTLDMRVRGIETTITEWSARYNFSTALFFGLSTAVATLVSAVLTVFGGPLLRHLLHP